MDMLHIFELISKVREENRRPGTVAAPHVGTGLGLLRVQRVLGEAVLAVPQLRRAHHRGRGGRLQLPRPPLAVRHEVLVPRPLVVNVCVLGPQLHRVQHLLHPLELHAVHLQVILVHALTEPVLLGYHLRLAERDLVDLLDVIVQVGCGVARVVAQGTDEGFLAAVDCDVILKCLCLVGFVITVGAVKLEYSCVCVLAVQHLIKPHVAVSTLVTPVKCKT